MPRNTLFPNTAQTYGEKEIPGNLNVEAMMSGSFEIRIGSRAPESHKLGQGMVRSLEINNASIRITNTSHNELQLSW